jgi:mRNA interferase MazF
MVRYIPKPGDVVWLDFDPQKGKEIQKTRPALTISPQSYNSKTGLGLFMPVTSKIKGYPFEVSIDKGEIHGAILCDQIRSLDWKVRNAKFVTHLSPSIFEEVLAKFRILLPAYTEMSAVN